MVFMPETPRWLLANNYRHEAIKALSWLRGNQYQIEEECFEIECALGFGKEKKIFYYKKLNLFIYYNLLLFIYLFFNLTHVL